MAQTQVSPGSAFWGLLAIALNTMSQPSGKVLGLPSKHSFALRSSPVVCGISAIDTVLEFCYYLQRTRSIRKAATAIIRFRLADLDHGVKDEFAALRKNTIFRAIAFFLGALPQAIKIYTMKGLHWTQILATLYITSFLIDELIFAMAAKEEVDPSSNLAGEVAAPPDRYWIFLAVGVLAFSVVLPQILVSASLYTLLQNCSYQTTTLMFTGALMVFFLHLGGLWFSTGIAAALFSAPLLIIGNTCTNATITGVMLLASSRENQLKIPNGTTVLAVAVSVTVKVLVSVWTFNKALKHIVSRYKSWTYFELSVYYLVLHMAAAILGYIVLYDPGSTSKPKWTDLLG